MMIGNRLPPGFIHYKQIHAGVIMAAAKVARASRLPVKQRVNSAGLLKASLKCAQAAAASTALSSRSVQGRK